MAVLTAQGISSLAIELLIRQLRLPRTVSMVPSNEYAGPNGGTITVRVPQPSSARTQANPGDLLTADDVDEVPVDVSLSHLYHLKNLTDQEMSFDIENFGRQVTRVQVAAVATGAEDQLASVMNSLAADASFAETATEDDTIAAILGAREFLGENDAPAEDRFMAVAPDIASRVLQVDQFVKVNESGGSDALRNAIIGRLYGFTFVESNALDAGTAVAYHRSGFVFANRIPPMPRGASDTATASGQGIGLRHLFQYDASRARDQSLVSTFAGAARVLDRDPDDDHGEDTIAKRYYKLDTAGS